MIYSKESDTTMVRRNPGIGHASARTCDQCQQRSLMGPGWSRGKVKRGQMRGFTGWICQRCKEQTQ